MSHRVVKVSHKKNMSTEMKISEQKTNIQGMSKYPLDFYIHTLSRIAEPKKFSELSKVDNIHKLKFQKLD